MLFMLLIMVGMLISVAFFTLFERKLLAIFHNRLGPNKSSIMGLTQPLADALKLLSKEFLYSPKMFYKIYVISPIIMMIIMLLLWTIFPSNFYFWSLNLNLLFMMCCFSVSVYPIMFSGWSSNSKYALIGSMRSLAQTISYEVSLTIIIISCIILIESFNFMYFLDYIFTSQLSNYLYLTFTMLYVSSLAEINRTPFDFVEGESELVSGFNVEYFGFGFAFIFLAEYSMIIWISGLNTIIFMTDTPFIPTTLSVAFSFIWVRASYPRMRYDELMYLCWKVFLPSSLFMLAWTIIFKFSVTINM